MNDRGLVQDRFRREVASRFGIVPNFFRSAEAAPELIEELWGFARAGYLDSPMPSLFKERLFVWLSRFCPVRYCIVRHVGFLLGDEHGHASGDPSAVPQSVDSVLTLLRRPTPWQRSMEETYALLETLPAPLDWPDPDTDLEHAIFACASVLFVEPTRSARARSALTHAVGERSFEFLCGFLAFIRTAHYWTLLHPEIETEEDMRLLLQEYEELARLLLVDPEGRRCEMDERLFEELKSLRELHERKELERAKQALEESHRKKDQFIAVLAHELRNPLGSIRTAADTLRLLKLADPRAGVLVERLTRQTNAMARMLEDLLDASSLAFEKTQIHSERVDLLTLVTDVLEEQQQRLDEAGLSGATQFELPACSVKGDRVRLRQILDNLLANAIKFTPSGGAIEISCTERDGFGVVTVRDTGVGFDRELAATMFEPFAQREQGRDRHAGGLGLGLAIADRFTRLHGGTLSATSAGPDRGSEFRLAIPLAGADDGEAPGEAPAGRADRRRVLVVEDNRDLAAGLAELLELTGVTVRLAFDGPSAIRMAIDSAPDVILCDLGLPGDVDGFEVARACRAQASLDATRLVAASGYSSPQDHADARAAGFDCLLTKPLTLESLSRITQPN